MNTAAGQGNHRNPSLVPRTNDPRSIPAQPRGASPAATTARRPNNCRSVVIFRVSEPPKRAPPSRKDAESRWQYRAKTPSSEPYRLQGGGVIAHVLRSHSFARGGEGAGSPKHRAQGSASKGPGWRSDVSFSALDLLCWNGRDGWREGSRTLAPSHCRRRIGDDDKSATRASSCKTVQGINLATAGHSRV